MKWSLLHVKVCDALTKQLMPARIHLKLPDESCYLPPAETDLRFQPDRAPQVILPCHFIENLHLCKQADLRSSHLSTGEATFPVPAGRCTLWVSRGHERRDVQRAFLAKPGETVHVEVALEKIGDMQALGWHSGDMHIHFTRQRQRDDYVLARLMAAEDLPAVNNMVYKAAGIVEAPQKKWAMRGPTTNSRMDTRSWPVAKNFVTTTSTVT